MTHSTLSALVETLRTNIFNHEVDCNITGLLKIDILPFAAAITKDIDEFLKPSTNEIIKSDLKTVLYKEDAKFFTKLNKELSTKEFFTYQGNIKDEEGKELGNLNFRLHNYTQNTKRVATVKLIKLIVQHHIAKQSNWQDATVFHNEIKSLLIDDLESNTNFNVDEIIDFIEVELDPLIIHINNIIYKKDWYVFNVYLKGTTLVIERLEDWRAYKWSMEQLALQQAIEDQKKEDETGQFK